MKKNPFSKSGLFNPRVLLAFTLCSAGALLAMLSFAAPTQSSGTVIAQGPITWIGQALAHTGLKLPFTNSHIVAASQPSGSFGVPSAPKRTLLRRSPANRRIASQGISSQGSSTLTPVVSEAVAATVSPPVRDLPAANQFSAWVERPEEGQLSNRAPQTPRNPLERDPVVQSAAPTVGMPPVGVSFEGMDIAQGCGNCLPPDTNGAVGPNHYVQMVNTDFAIYSKTGATLVAPTAVNMLWTLTPNSECFTHNNGDPVVVYDQLADRWLLSQFVVQASTENYAQCIAISTSPDPTGTYFLYEFDESADTFHDYPKIGVWPDGYYMTTNLFPNSALLTSTGAGAWAFERPKMLLGQTAKYVFFDETSLATNTYTPGGQLPATVDGKVPPPAGAPNYFVEVDDTNTPNTPPATGLHDEMHIWQFHVDWTNPANSTFGTGSTAPALKPGFPGQYAGNAGQPNFIIPIADYVASGCQIENGPNDCSPEKLNPPQPAQYLDVLGDRLMFRLVYRNFGDHESLLVNHTVDAAADQPMGVARNGVRWYEVRNLSTTPSVYQQGTFAPFDPTSLNGPLWRWMGSVAMDQSGDIAIGYSASGPNYFPSLHYAGRLASDPLNELTQGEAVMFLGLGIEVNTGIFPFRNRWGDYSDLTVDPTDDCTFWYTNEYLAANNPTDIFPVDWHTRIGSFKFPQCGPPTLLSVVSEMTHGTITPPFDINFPLPPTTSPRGVECRSSALLGAGNYKLVFTFLNNLTSVANATVTSHDPATATGSVSGSGPGPGLNQYTVNLTNVSTGQYITVTLNSVLDALGHSGNVLSPSMGFLVGDVNFNGVASNADVSLVKAQVAAGASVGPSNFQDDINANGVLSNADVSLTKAQVAAGAQLPSPP